MIPKRIRVGLTVLVVLASAAYWFVYRSRRGPRGEATIRIGAIDPLTGPFASYGEPVRDGMLLAIEEMNAKGGINGRKVELLLEDDSGDPKASVNAFTKLAVVSKVPVIIGPLIWR